MEDKRVIRAIVKDNEHQGWEYYINDKKVSELAYFDLEYITDLSDIELKALYSKVENEEPFNRNQPHFEWNFKMGVIATEMKKRNPIDFIIGF